MINRSIKGGFFGLIKQNLWNFRLDEDNININLSKDSLEEIIISHLKNLNLEDKKELGIYFSKGKEISGISRGNRRITLLKSWLGLALKSILIHILIKLII